MSISIELPPSGGVLLSYKFVTVRLYTYFESSSAFWHAWEFLVVIFYVFYATIEVIQGVRFGWRRFLKVYFMPSVSFVLPHAAILTVTCLL